MLPLDPFGRVSAPPAGLTREDRVRLLREAADALMQGQLPPAAARLFVGGALLAWLREGGSLERQYLRVAAPKGSHLTPSALLRRRDDGASSR